MANEIQIIPPEETKLLENKPAQNIRINTFNYFAAPLKKRYEKHYKGNLSHLIIDLALAAVVFILLAVIFSNWLFWRAKTTNLMDLKVEANTGELVNGQKVEFNLTYTNTTKDELADCQLVLKIPTGLKSVAIEPAINPTNNTLEIGNLAPHAFGSMKISGEILDNIGAPQKFLVAITYKNKYGLIQQEYFSEIFDLSRSAITSELQLPAKIISGSPFYTTLKLKNISNEDYQDLKLQIHWPAEFTLLSSELGAIDSENYFKINSLKINEEKTFRVYGKLYIKEPKKFSAYVNIYRDYKGADLIFSRANANSLAAFSKFIVSFSNTQNNANLTPGNQTVYEINLKNTENYTVKDVKIYLQLKGEYLDQAFLSKNYKLSNTSPYWDTNSIADLAEFTAGQSYNFKVPVRALSDFSPSALPEHGYNINATIMATFFDPKENGTIEVESPVLETKINTTVSIKTFGLFYTPQGDQIGVGTVPPVVGEYTFYWVVIRVKNTNNLVNNLKVTATIPEGVEYNDVYNVTAGNQIRHSGNQLEWVITSVDKFSGLFYAAPEARIQLGIVPSEKQVGTSPVLLSNIRASGIDQYTVFEVNTSAPNITTAIFDDVGLNKVSK